MNELFKSPFFMEKQTDDKSYLEHNLQYCQINLQKEIERQQKNTIEKTQYTADAPLGLAIDKSYNLKIAVDIGSGCGWTSNLLSETKDVVYSIEPSIAAIKIAKKIHPDNTKITWLNGFAEAELKKLSFNEPALFISLCVLSHLKDETVVEICKEIDRIALPGSILGFSENFGVIFDDGNLWKCREEKWWQQRFIGWNFDFSVGRTILHPNGAKKDFIAVKVK